MFHAKRVECAIFIHLLVNISGILHARPTYDISSRSPIFGDHFDTNGKVSHDSCDTIGRRSDKGLSIFSTKQLVKV